ncbi:MAG: hypothetical protein KDD46_06615 [Bdellovibrionales bacterium]|nr:hypothetical protein [Bdellovibrionales bacterium]
MKKNTKSSITLPKEELKEVKLLQKKLNIKTKVEVIRRGLKLLKESTDRELLREEFKRASQEVLGQTEEFLRDHDHLTGENL